MSLESLDIKVWERAGERVSRFLNHALLPVKGGRNLLLKLLKDENGQTLTEYGLIMLLVVVVVISALIFYRKALQNRYNEIINNVPNA